VDLVPIDADLSGYRAVITPALFLLDEAGAGRLASYVADGGCWVATHFTGYVDGNNRCWCGGFPGPNLREVFGLWNEEVDYIFDDEDVLVQGCVDGLSERMRAKDVIEHLHAEGASAMATLGSEFYASSPIILRNQWKEGLTYYVGARLEEESLISFYRVLAGELALPYEKLPLGVVRKVRLGSEGAIEFLFNYTKREVAIDLGEDAFLGISDGREITGETTLHPYETLVRNILPLCPDALPLVTPHSLHHDPPIPSQS